MELLTNISLGFVVGLVPGFVFGFIYFMWSVG